MTLAERIKALPGIKDEAGSECVSREVVLGLVAAPLSYEACDRLLKDIDEDESKLSALIGNVLTHWEQLSNDVKGELGPLNTALIALWNHMECK